MTQLDLMSTDMLGVKMVHYEISYPEFSANRLWIFSNVLLFDDLNIPQDVGGH
jgi:hypothetical protein